MDLVKPPPAVRPAEGELDPVRWATRQQALEAGITVHLQHAREPGQVSRRVLAFAVLGVEVDHRRRGAALPGSVIDRVAPQAAGLGPAPAGVEHRQARVVGEDPGRAHDVPAQQAPQRLQPPARPADPVAERGAVELDPLPGADPGVERSGRPPRRPKPWAGGYRGSKSPYLATSPCATTASAAIPPATGRSGA